ncbi:MAG: hypothetical protein ACOX44_01480 [Limnochordia bacterium]|jgi:hypothetical protein
MQARVRHILAVAGICAILLLVAPFAGAERAQFRGEGVSSYLSLSDGGNVLKHDGNFTVTYKDYIVTGQLGEFYRAPANKEGATTRDRVVITKGGRVVQSGDDALEIKALDLIDMDLATEGILAKGQVEIITKNTVITAEYMESGDLERIRPLVEEAVKNLDSRYFDMVEEWLGKADSSDRLLLLDGNVAAKDPQFVFTGQKLIVNATKEVYLFLGPHTIELDIED